MKKVAVSEELKVLKVYFADGTGELFAISFRRTKSIERDAIRKYRKLSLISCFRRTKSIESSSQIIGYMFSPIDVSEELKVLKVLI